MNVSHCHDEGGCRMVRVMFAALGSLVNNERTLVVLLAPYDLEEYHNSDGGDLLYPIIIPPQLSPYYFAQFMGAQRPSRREFPGILRELSGITLEEVHIFGDEQYVRMHMHFRDKEGTPGVFSATPPDMLLFALQTSTPIYIEEELLKGSADKVKFNFVGDINKREQGVTLPEEVRESLGKFIAQQREKEHRRNMLRDRASRFDATGREVIADDSSNTYLRLAEAIEQGYGRGRLEQKPLLFSNEVYDTLLHRAIELERYEWAGWLSKLEQVAEGWSYMPSNPQPEQAVKSVPPEHAEQKESSGYPLIPKSDISRTPLVQVIYSRFRVYGRSGKPHSVDFCFRVAPRSGDPFQLLMQEQWEEATLALNLTGRHLRDLLQCFIESRKKASIAGLPPDALVVFQGVAGLFPRRLLILKGTPNVAGSTSWVLELMDEAGEIYHVGIKEQGEALIYSYLYGLPLYAAEEVLWEDDIRQIPFRAYLLDQQYGLEDLLLSHEERLHRSIRGEIPMEALQKLYPRAKLHEILSRMDLAGLLNEAVEREQYEWAQLIQDYKEEQAIWQQRSEE